MEFRVPPRLHEAAKKLSEQPPPYHHIKRSILVIAALSKADAYLTFIYNEHLRILSQAIIIVSAISALSLAP
jgi:hypothetical protein